MATIQNIDFSNTKGQLKLRSQRSDLAEIQTHLRYCSYSCDLQEDPLKNKDARVVTTQNMDFSNTQGQITPQSEVGSGRNSNSYEM